MWISFLTGISLFSVVCLLKLLRDTKPKHRTEFLPLHLFFYSWSWNTRIPVSRAFLPLQRPFEKRPFGLITSSVQCFLKVVGNDTQQTPLLAIGKRRNRTITNQIVDWDVGAAGMIGLQLTSFLDLFRLNTYHNWLRICRNPEIICLKELQEEYGVLGSPEYIGRVTPAQGYNCLQYVYEITLPSGFQFDLDKTDGTFTKIKLIPTNQVTCYRDNKDGPIKDRLRLKEDMEQMLPLYLKKSIF